MISYWKLLRGSFSKTTYYKLLLMFGVFVFYLFIYTFIMKGTLYQRKLRYSFRILVYQTKY